MFSIDHPELSLQWGDTLNSRQCILIAFALQVVYIGCTEPDCYKTKSLGLASKQDLWSAWSQNLFMTITTQVLFLRGLQGVKQGTMLDPICSSAGLWTFLWWHIEVSGKKQHLAEVGFDSQSYSRIYQQYILLLQKLICIPK